MKLLSQPIRDSTALYAEETSLHQHNIRLDSFTGFNYAPESHNLPSPKQYLRSLQLTPKAYIQGRIDHEYGVHIRPERADS
jgi:hypothetical protein